MLLRCKYKESERKNQVFNNKTKSQLGVQFDGYCSTVATTIVVGANGAVSGAKADAIQAARTALEAAVRQIRPGNRVRFFLVLFFFLINVLYMCV